MSSEAPRQLDDVMLDAIFGSSYESLSPDSSCVCSVVSQLLRTPLHQDEPSPPMTHRPIRHIPLQRRVPLLEILVLLVTPLLHLLNLRVPLGQLPLEILDLLRLRVLAQRRRSRRPFLERHLHSQLLGLELLDVFLELVNPGDMESIEGTVLRMAGLCGIQCGLWRVSP